MRWDLFLWAGFAALGCSPDTGDDSGMCSRSDRTGTYLVQYTERSGDCGALNEEVGRLDGADAPVPPGCAIVGEAWEDGECTLTREIACDSGARITAVTTQEDATGDRLTGVFQLNGVDGTGLTCSSTYDVVATRQ